MAGIGATYEIVDNLLFNLETYYRGKRNYANDFNGEYGKAMSYTITNISLRYSFDNGISIYGGIDNLFDKKYYEYGYLVANTKKKTIDVKVQPSPERTYYVGFDYKF